MPKRSTEFQKIVMLIEQQRAPDVKICESDMLEDRLTRQKREVDITIKSKLGDLDIIISVEVNERKRKADVQWIEQQFQKHQSLPTNKLILVSKSGFYLSAMEKARSLGVDTVSMDNMGDYRFGYQVGEITNMRMNFTLPIIYLNIDGDEIFLSNLILKCRQNGKEFDISGGALRMLGYAIDFKKFHEMAPPNHEVRIMLNAAVGAFPITFNYKKKKYEIKDKITITGYVKKFTIPVICRIGTYRTDHVILATSHANAEEKLLVVLPRDGRKGRAVFKGIEMELGQFEMENP